jgi:signal transduction histidine kinase
VGVKDALRRVGPGALVGLALVFGGLSAGYAWSVARHLRQDAREMSRLFGQVVRGLSDPRPDAATGALLDLAGEIRTLRIPIVVTDATGRVAALDNVPPEVAHDSAAVRRFIARLDVSNPPIVQPGVGTIHYGSVPIARRLGLVAVLQGGVLLCLAALVVWAVRSRVAAERDRLWAAMARESAHQLGTPLMSLTGWIAFLRENPEAPAGELADHLQADAERLERVAKRFERIGRPTHHEPVALGAIAERVATYFQHRLPTLANPVHLTLQAAGPGPTVAGDPVLVEWALEALVKNAIDALSGRGGRVEVRVESAGAVARVAVQDDGPGVAPAVRSRLFEPGVSTKPGGWGMGLALARRIVEQQHGGRLTYHDDGAGRGSRFVMEFPGASG